MMVVMVGQILVYLVALLNDVVIILTFNSVILGEVKNLDFTLLLGN
ncbi:hypothetical protein BN938_1373 [Mucinivorans hirudinis]|uniref:Uncharacterized protein n=1 Tax=Mucinivorans hirudinis TaxID=1433126 RepID=A0A060R7Y5_9BACT|nr:hypothetical protein BN938_1373 [Mucinivorans hirudinis]